MRVASTVGQLVDHLGKATPGELILLEGGTYAAEFVSESAGTPAFPVRVRSAPGEWARIDGRVTGNAECVRWEHVEITDTAVSRVGFVRSGATLNQYRSGLRHCVIHDVNVSAIEFWSGVKGGELYGCITYYQGAYNPALLRWGGHAVYTQNVDHTVDGEAETKKIRLCIFGPGGGWGTHAYTEGGNIDRYLWEANVHYGAGQIGDHLRPNFLIGGDEANHHTIRRMYSYKATPNEDNISVGYAMGVPYPDDLRIEGGDWIDGSVGTVMVGEHLWLTLAVSDLIIEGRQNGGSTSPLVEAGATVYPYGSGPPRYHVEPSEYEDGWAHVIIRNPDADATFDIDVSSVLDVGDTFGVFDGLNPLAGPILTGTFDGDPIPVPMTGLDLPTPVGDVAGTPVHPAPAWGVFVVRREQTWVAP